LRRAVDTLDAIRAEHDAKASQEGDGR